jgi:hypothetical protein
MVSKVAPMTGPPIETFGGDDFRGISSRFVDPPQLAAGAVHFAGVGLLLAACNYF